MDLSQSASLPTDSASAAGTKTIVNLLALFLIIAGTVFKKMYWAGADVILLTATLALLATLIFLYRDLQETTRNGTATMLLTGLLFFLIVSALFRRFHWEGSTVLVIAAGVVALVAAVYLIFRRDEIRLPKQLAITFILYIIYIVGAVSFLSLETQAVLDQALQNQ